MGREFLRVHTYREDSPKDYISFASYYHLLLNNGNVIEVPLYFFI